MNGIKKGYWLYSNLCDFDGYSQAVLNFTYNYSPLLQRRVFHNSVTSLRFVGNYLYSPLRHFYRVNFRANFNKTECGIIDLPISGSCVLGPMVKNWRADNLCWDSYGPAILEFVSKNMDSVIWKCESPGRKAQILTKLLSRLPDVIRATDLNQYFLYI